MRDGKRAECAVEYLRDITQRKELAAELLKQQKLLEAVIIDITGRLAGVRRRGRHHSLQSRRAGALLHGAARSLRNLGRLTPIR